MTDSECQIRPLDEEGQTYRLLINDLDKCGILGKNGWTYFKNLNYSELIGWNHQTTNLVFPKFFHSFFLVKEDWLFTYKSLKCKIWTQMAVESFTKTIRHVMIFFFISKIYVFSILGFHQCPCLVSKVARRCNDVRSRSNYHVQTSWKSSHTKQGCRICWRTVSNFYLMFSCYASHCGSASRSLFCCPLTFVL